MAIAEMQAKWVGSSFDSAELEIDETRMLEFAGACGVSDPRFCVRLSANGFNRLGKNVTNSQASTIKTNRT